MKDLDEKWIKTEAKEMILKCKDFCYWNRDVGNKSEWDYWDWKDWEYVLVTFGKKILNKHLKESHSKSSGEEVEISKKNWTKEYDAWYWYWYMCTWCNKQNINFNSYCCPDCWKKIKRVD